MQLAEADLDVTNLAFDAQNGTDSGDAHLYVKFFMKPRQNMSKSQEAGRPVYDDTEYVEIMQPGNKENIINRPASKQDKQRFAKAYKHFKENNDGEAIEGTPLEQWPVLNKSQVEELKFFNVRTVEQLANISDSNIQGFMAGQQLKQRAQAFLEVSGQVVDGEKLATKVDSQETEITMLKKLNEDLVKKVEALEAKQEQGEE